MKVTLQLVNRFLLVPGVISGAKYAQDGELFARMTLEDRLSEDTTGGRLILNNCQTAWFTLDVPRKDEKQPLKVGFTLVIALKFLIFARVRFFPLY